MNSTWTRKNLNGNSAATVAVPVAGTDVGAAVVAWVVAGAVVRAGAVVGVPAVGAGTVIGAQATPRQLPARKARSPRNVIDCYSLSLPPSRKLLDDA